MKKKLFFMSAFVFALILVLVNVDGKEVKAEENCETKTYYYLFMDSSNKTLFDFSNGDHTYNTLKYFKLPNEVDSNDYNVTVENHGRVDIHFDSTASEYAKTIFPLGLFHNVMKQTKSLDNYTFGYEYHGDVFYRALPWSKDGGESTTTASYSMPDSYDEFAALVPKIETYITSKTTFVTSSLTKGEAPAITPTVIKGKQYSALELGVNRTWAQEDISHISNDAIVWTPAAYYVDYKICTVSEPEDYTITIRYVDKDTGFEIADDYILIDNEPSGTPYEYNCDAKKIDNYSLYKDDEDNFPTTFEGEVSGDDTLTCYYNQAKTYKLTVEHYEQGNTKDKLIKDYTKTGYASGDDYKYKCQDIPGYNVVNSSSYPSTIEGEFSNSDIKKQCYYSKKDYTLTVNYGEDEDCTKLLGDSYTTKLKYKEKTKVKVPTNFDKLNNPKLGTFSSQFTTKPTLDGNYLNVTMPAKDVSVCIVYTAQTGASWIYLAWVIGGLALGYSIWYFVRYFKKQNGEI